MSEPLEYIEFETKYRVDQSILLKFKQILVNLPEVEKLLYIEGEDQYFVNNQNPNRFLRYRTAAFGLDGNRAEVTMKIKPEGSKNNIIRTEINWRVDITPKEDILEGIRLLDYSFNFSIYKMCQIYKLADATLVFYTVYDTTNEETSKRTDSFIEIEVAEDKIRSMTEQDAWKIIEKYENILAPVGITARNRLRKSLFEMYTR